MRDTIKRILEGAMEGDIVDRLRAGLYKRTELRRGYRNGYRYRSVLTRFGLIPNLKVPRDRAVEDSPWRGVFQTRVISRYQRSDGRVHRMIRDLFLAGVSTRRVGEILAPILGYAPSAQTVSRVTRSLDGEVRRFQGRPLKDCYLYLLLDGITMKVKHAGGVGKRLILCAYGVTPAGVREMVAFRQAASESEAQWEAFLNDLYKRGLRGRTLSLVVTDGNAGLHGALDTVFPYVPRQRCWAHKLRNVAAKLSRTVQEDCLEGAKRIYQASTRREGVARFREWAALWREGQSRAVSCVEKDLDELLSFLDQPEAHWRKIRTTNAIERAFREVRRRTRPMSCFQNKESVDRIIYGILTHLNANWKEKPLPEFTHYS